MGIIDTLGSRRRVTTALTTLLGEGEIRALCERHHLTVPGFREGRGPLPLLARRVATACETDRKLRATLEEKMHRLAAKPGPAAERLAELERLAAPEARSVLAAALSDTREDVVRTAMGIVDAIEAGRMRLATRPTTPARTSDRRGTDRDGARRPSGERPPARAARDGALDELRREATRLEAERARLRELLDTERDAHARTRRKVRELESRGRGKSADPRALEDARASLRRRESELVDAHAALESARTDMGVLIDAARALEALLESRADPALSNEPARPSRPRKRSDVPPAQKIRIPASDFWPARLDVLLRRLAADETVAAVHVLGASSGRASRILADVAVGAFIAQHADGEHAAQLLVLTTADSRPSHAWMRRHLAAEYFSGR